MLLPANVVRIRKLPPDDGGVIVEPLIVTPLDRSVAATGPATRVVFVES